MKLHPLILLIVIIVAVIVGMNAKDISFSELLENEDLQVRESAEASTSANTASSNSSGLTPEYFTKFFKDNNFKVLPVYKGNTSDIYTGKLDVEETNIEVRLDVYYERSSKEVLLIESTIEGIYYMDYHNQQEAIDLVNKVAEHYFGVFASIPYHSSSPAEAESWIKDHIKESYAETRVDELSKQFGLANFNTYGTPLVRTLEIDFGF